LPAVELFVQEKYANAIFGNRIAKDYKTSNVTLWLCRVICLRSFNVKGRGKQK
jgi:hypothetical protein